MLSLSIALLYAVHCRVCAYMGYLESLVPFWLVVTKPHMLSSWDKADSKSSLYNVASNEFEDEDIASILNSCPISYLLLRLQPHLLQHPRCRFLTTPTRS